MEKNKTFGVFLLCVLAFLLGYFIFGWSGTSAEKIKDKTLSRISDVKTYSFSTYITINTVGELQGFPVDMTDAISGEGAVDVPGKRMLFDVTINSTSDKTLVSGKNMKVYFIDDKVYFQSNGTTVDEKISDADVIWKKRTQLKQQAEILSKSEVKLLKEEKTGDSETYVLGLYPKKEELVGYIAEQASVGGTPLSVSDAQIANLSGMVKEFSIILWVGKDDFLPRKFRMSMNLSSGKLVRESETLMAMWGYDKPVAIDLPGKT
jgi:outer membrane lipoprotein-sorting protein